MDIGINEVKDMIESLESNGELSIKEEKYLNVAKLCVQLAAENVALKAGDSYFSYGSEHNFEWHKTAEEAVEAAEAEIDDYRGDACDGWSEEVDSVCWGIIMQSSTKVGERPRNEDDRCDPAFDTVCDYALLPNIETPATDRIVAGIKASAIPEGFKLVPEQMYLSDEDIQAICMQCGNGDKKGYGDYEDGILWVGELSNDGEMKYGLNIANANYPEEGSITVFEFDEPLREGADK